MILGKSMTILGQNRAIFSKIGKVYLNFIPNSAQSLKFTMYGTVEHCDSIFFFFKLGKKVPYIQYGAVFQPLRQKNPGKVSL